MDYYGNIIDEKAKRLKENLTRVLVWSERLRETMALSLGQVDRMAALGVEFYLAETGVMVMAVEVQAPFQATMTRNERRVVLTAWPAPKLFETKDWPRIWLPGGSSLFVPSEAVQAGILLELDKAAAEVF